ncbi:tetratricopeptide (TPR) repeat protein [Kibdelosporangium banguiense]|uniref:Tetratricopeptide (TPR) repeat protein n=1 Tax=Kibdelosporangium banguiense TaxID=1365924 RepID=A0ABS4TS40_9PSEU|nr:tetratricopeptide repeat protein [Kibdelosporangium banguiense]MBP2327224.1 tetratricopeptide (TPR) repeat protein [Kibdelosporangium banguiense]
MTTEPEPGTPASTVRNDVSGQTAFALQAGMITGNVRIDARSAAPAIPHQLPAGSGVFIGRSGLLAWLDRTLVPQGLAVITGMAGVGKTALAVRWAQASTAFFPDGQLYVDLRGFGAGESMRPHEALAGFLRALGQSRPEAIPTLEERSAHYRTLLNGKRVLIVLDNAPSIDHVRPLLPGSSTCSVVVISRLQMGGLVVHHDASARRVEPMRNPEGVDLLRRTIGSLADESTISRLAELCDGLPLAIRIAAERVADTPSYANDLVTELADARLDFLDSGDDGHSAVRSVFSWSYQGLTDDEARMFRLLSLHPAGTFAGRAAAAAAGCSLDAAARLVRSLVRRCLVSEPERGRYQIHDLMSEYGRELCENSESIEAVTRLFDHYLHTADRAGRIIMPHRLRVPLDGSPVAVTEIPDRHAALRWFRAERRNLESMCALDEPGLDARIWQLAYALRDFYFLHKLLDGWQETHLHALAASVRSGDRLAEARTRNNLGMALVEAGDLDEAMNHYRQAEHLFEQLDDGHGRSNALSNQAAVLRRQGEYAAALRNQEQALAWYRNSGAKRNVGITLRSMALAEMELGRFAQAVQHIEESLDIAMGLGLDVDAAEAFGRLGRIQHRAGNNLLAEIAFRQAVEYSRRCDSRHEEAHGLHQMGRLAAGAGRLGEARQLLSEARDLYQELGSQAADGIADELAGLAQD